MTKIHQAATVSDERQLREILYFARDIGHVGVGVYGLLYVALLRHPWVPQADAVIWGGIICVMGWSMFMTGTRQRVASWTIAGRNDLVSDFRAWTTLAFMVPVSVVFVTLGTLIYDAAGRLIAH